MALLVWQVLAELVEIVLQCGARVLSGLQLAVQPQHVGLLLQQLLSLALGEAGTQRHAPLRFRFRETPRLLPTCLGMPVQAVPLLPPGGHLAPYLQLADPLLQGIWASGDGGLLRQRGLEASDDPVRFLDLPLQTQGSLGSAAGEADG